MRPRLVPFVLVAALLGCAGRHEPPGPSWPALLAPLATGREVTRGYVLRAPARGHEDDVVFRAERPDGRLVEVHVVARGQWRGVRETRSFGVAWEEPRTRAPRADAEAVTAALHAAIAAHDRGGLTLAALPLDPARSATARERGVHALARLGTRAPLPWALVALALVALARGRRAPPSREALALGAAALALRVPLGLWGPFHINQQGALWIEGVLRPEVLRAYGPGFAELHGLAARLVAPDHAVFALHALLGALAAPLAFALARRLGLPRERALLAGAVVALDPALVRVAASESYVTPIVSLTLASAWALVAAAQSNGPRPTRLLRAAGVLCAVQAVRIHPLGWLAAALVPATVFAGLGLREALRAAALVAAVTLATSGAVLAQVLTAVAGRAVMAPALQPRVALLALAPGLAFALLPATRRLAPTALASLLAGGMVWCTYGQSDAWQQTALRVTLLGPLLAIVSSLPTRYFRAQSAALLAVVLALGASIVRYRTTDQTEYAWVRRWLAARPPGCRVAWVAFAGDRRTAFLPVWALRGTAVPLDGRTPWGAPARLAPLGCTYYLRPAACETPDGAPACAAVEAGLALAPETSVSLPAVASHRGLPYPDPIVRIRSFRVTGLRAEAP